MKLTRKSAITVFLVGTLSSLTLFLILTIDTHRQVRVLTKAQDLSDEVVQGKRVWQKYNCNDCHTILGFGGYYAPDMTRVYKRIGAPGIQERVRRPEVVLANSWRKMPQQHVSDAELHHLVAFFAWVNDIDTHNWPPQDSGKTPSWAITRMAASAGLAPGAALIKERGCFACHALGGVGSDAGPALDRIDKPYDRSTLARYIRNPSGVDPKSQMPAQPDVTPDEADQIAAFLLGSR